MYDDYIIDHRTLSFPSLVLYTFSRILVNKQSFAKNNRNLAVRACVVTIDPLSWRYSEMFVRQRGGFRSRDEARTFLRYRCVTSRNLWTKITIFRGISWYSLVFLCISWYFLVLLGISWYFLVFLGCVHASSCNERYVARFIGTRDSRFAVATKCSLMDGRNANVRNARRRSNDVRRSSIWWNNAETRSMAGHLLEKRGLSRARQTVAAVWYRSAAKSRYLVSQWKNLVSAG